MLLAHFVGDIHQPLHVGALYLDSNDKPVNPNLGAPGFVSVQYLWASEEPGKVAQITTWLTPDDCRRYVREGDAATIATLEETAIPTAPYPHGAWNRITLEAVET